MCAAHGTFRSLHQNLEMESMRLNCSRFIVGLLPAVVLLVPATLASAAPIMNASSGLSNPTNTIGFDEVALPQGTVVTNQFSAFGATFDSWTYNIVNNSSIPAPVLTHFDGSPVASIFFNDPVTDAAFRLQTNTGNTTFEARLNGVLVESFSAPTTFPSNTDWFGFQGILFDEIRILAGGRIANAVMGQLQFNVAAVTAAPEPTSLALWGMGLLGLAVSRARRRREAA